MGGDLDPDVAQPAGRIDAAGIEAVDVAGVLKRAHEGVQAAHRHVRQPGQFGQRQRAFRPREDLEQIDGARRPLDQLRFARRPVLFLLPAHARSCATAIWSSRGCFCKHS